MASMNMRELRDTRRLKGLLRAGKSIELRDRDVVIGRIVPTGAEGRAELPDFAARRTALFGKRSFSGAAIVIEERGRF